MDNIEQFFIDNLKEKHDLILTEYSEFVRHNSQWITQVITISGTILGGIVLTQNSLNQLGIIGVVCLFTTINAGLFLMYITNKKFANRLFESFAVLTDYTTMFFRLKDLSSKTNLTDIEKNEMTELQKELLNVLQDIGIMEKDSLTGNFKPGSVYKMHLRSKSLDWSNYILITLFFISGVIIILSKLS